MDVLWRSAPNNGKRFFAWCYYQKPRDLRDRSFTSQVHKIRDGLAFVNVSTALCQAGYKYAGAVLNIPATEAAGGQVSSTEAECATGDILLMMTRPPLDEPTRRDRGGRWVDPSGYATEHVLFRELKDKVFERCRRTEIALRADLCCEPKGATIFRSIKFAQKQGGAIAALCGEPNAPWESATPPEDKEYAAGYLLVLPTVGEHKFRLLGAFSAGGAETLWWSWLLTHRRRDLLEAALRATEPKVWLGLFAIPKKAPTFLTPDDSIFSLSSRKTDRTWPDLITWSRN